MASGKRVYLVDGANYVFRAFYAIRNLTSSKGQPTGAIYGFAQMLLKLLRDEKPDLVAVCFDTAEPTFRDEMYEEYKSNRKEPPDELVAQFPYVSPIVEALGLAAVEKPGFEADDLIGTLALRFSKKGHEVVIVSGDKDLMQLIRPGVSILDEMKQKRVGENEVVEKFGVGPKQVIEVLGLCGDASDNIPGVAGVGPKTAAKLIIEFGSIEEVINNADKIKGTLGAKIKQQAETAFLSRRLATIDTDVKIDVDEADLIVKPIDKASAYPIFKELEFTKLLNTLLPQSSFENAIYETSVSKDRLSKIISEITKVQSFSFQFMLENDDLIAPVVRGLVLSWGNGRAAYLSVNKLGEPSVMAGNLDLFSDSSVALFSLQNVIPLFIDPSIVKYVYNYNRELMILKTLGFLPQGEVFDVMLASYVLSPSLNHDVGFLAQKYLDITLDEKPKSYDESKLIFCKQVDVVYRLAQIFKKQVQESGEQSVLKKIEMPLVDVLVDMQKIGVMVDCGALERLSKTFAVEMEKIEKKIYKIAGSEFNINSPKQLGEILFEKLGLSGAKKTKTGYSTSQDILEDLASEHDLPRLVLDYRSYSKLKNTYIDALPKLVHKTSGRIHTSFNQAVTATGRLSSSDPNLQNIPARSEDGRKIRESFIAPDGFMILSADYSQIELRVLAHLSKDVSLTAAFSNNEDVHAMTAANIFGVDEKDVTKEQRAVGKTVNFAVIYGQTPFGLSKQLGISAGEAFGYIENYFKKYPEVAKYREKVLGEALENGYVKTLFGRVRYFQDIGSTNLKLAELNKRMAFNTVFQGTAADIIKRAMISIHRGLMHESEDARMILQVHDELVFEIPKKEVEDVKQFVLREMQGAANLDVPLVVDVGVGENWAKAH